MMTIVFDVGNVLIDFRYRDHMRDLGFSEQAVEELSRRMVLTEFWKEMDLGVRMEKDALEKFTAEMPEYREEIETFWAHTEGLVAEYPYAEPLVKSYTCFPTIRRKPRSGTGPPFGFCGIRTGISFPRMRRWRSRIRGCTGFWNPGLDWILRIVSLSMTVRRILTVQRHWGCRDCSLQGMKSWWKISARWGFVSESAERT